MRREHDRDAAFTHQGAQERKNRVARRLVERTGRLVGQQEPRLGSSTLDKSPCAGARPRKYPGCGDPGGARSRRPPPLSRKRADVSAGGRLCSPKRRHAEVFLHGEIGDEVVELEDKTNVPLAQLEAIGLPPRPSPHTLISPASGTSSLPHKYSGAVARTARAPESATISPAPTSKLTPASTGTRQVS